MATSSPIFDCCAEQPSEYRDSAETSLDLPPGDLELQGDNSNVDQRAKSEIALIEYKEEKEEDNDPVLPRGHKFKLVDRIGWWATVILPLSTLFIVAAIGFLAFLWSGKQSNPTWRLVMVNGWATRAVSLTSALVRNAADMQAGIAVAMLAALALESFQVCLADAAKMSSLRSGRCDPFDLLPSVFGSFKWNHGVLFVPTTLLICTTFLLQFSSTVLLSDLDLGKLPGHTRSSLSPIDLSYSVAGTYYPSEPWIDQYYRVQAPLMPHKPTWQRSPTAFPTFAEYSDTVDVKNQTSDTGRLLRAFLPFTDALSRETISNYTGKAMVLDSRVSCQQPVLDRLRVSFNWCASGGPYNPSGRTYQISGLVSPSMVMPKLVTASLPVPFSCQYLIGAANYSLCQLQVPYPKGGNYLGGKINPVIAGNRAGGLASEFADIRTPNNYTSYAGPVSYGTAFLFFHSPVSEVSSMDLDYLCQYDSDQNATMTMSAHSEWVDATLLPKQKFCPAQPDNPSFYNKNGSCSTPSYISSLSVSLCYAAWDAAVVSVGAYSNASRSEPTADFDPTSATYQFDEVRHQLNYSYNKSQSVEHRGIMSLRANNTWLPALEDELPFAWQPFVQNCGDIAGPLQQSVIIPAGSYKMSQMSGNQTILLYEKQASSIGLGPDQASQKFGIADGGPLPNGTFFADPTHSGLFLDILANNGSLAQAFSSIITVLSSMAYYDQFAQFSKSVNTTQVFFTTVLYPQMYRGFIAYVGVIAIHLCVVAFITTTFTSLSQYTLLGNDWTAFTQIFCVAGKDPFERTLAKDSEIVGSLRAIGQDKIKVGIGWSDQSSRVELISRQSLPKARV
jgi:hypothetical protein